MNIIGGSLERTWPGERVDKEDMDDVRTGNTHGDNNYQERHG